jgi:predicted esterase
MFRLLCIVVLLALVSPAPASAQADLHEVGLRLRTLEEAYGEQTDPAARRRAMAPLQLATTVFLAKQYGATARQLDLAALALASDKEPTPADLWARSLRVSPDARLVDASAGSVLVNIAPVYDVDAPRPDRLQVRCSLSRRDGKPIAQPVTFDIAKLPFEGKLPLKGLTEGDYLLTSEVLVGGEVRASWKQTLALANRLEERLERLRRGAGELPESAPRVEAGTVRQLAAALTALHGKGAMGLSIPPVHLLTDAEAALESARAGKGYYGGKRTGQFWLELPTRNGPTPVRLLAPSAAKNGKPMPLLIALHGAGGNEHVYFEVYGHGLAARLCEERGWLLVSPRGDLPDGLIEEISRLYPVDGKRIYLVGHSLGAARVVAAAGREPERFAGVAPLGGGGGFKPSEALREVPFFVAAGTGDFALAPTRSLYAALRKAGVKRLRLREYEGIEHLLVVQEALPELLAFFEGKDRP